jgi:hypothetical protein
VLESGKRGIEEFTAWDDDNIEACGGLALTEQLPDQPFGAIANDGAADLSRGSDTETGRTVAPGPSKHRHESTADSTTLFVGSLKVGAATDVLVGLESHPSSDTVSRLRPLARRRFST